MSIDYFLPVPGLTMEGGIYCESEHNNLNFIRKEVKAEGLGLISENSSWLFRL